MNEQDIQKYEKMLEEDPGSRAFAPLAEAHRKAGNLDDAIRVAETGLEIHPGYTGGLVVLGRALFEKKELDRAKEVLQKAVAETPESYLGQKYLGRVLFEKGENQAALQALETAYAQSPDDAEIAELLEVIRPKAAPPETIDFAGAGEGDEPGDTGIVTYEQKPTTVDGVELEPLPSKVDEETFTFSEIQDENRYPAAEPAVQSEGPADTEMEAIDELGPEAAAFIQEADQVDVSVFNEPGQEAEEAGDTFTIEELIEETGTEITPEQAAPASPVPPEQVTAAGRPPATDTGVPVEEVSEPAGEAAEPEQVIHPESLLSPEAEVARQPIQEASQMNGATGGRPAEEAVETAQTGTPDTTVEPLERPQPAQPSPDRSASGVDISTETLADLYANQGLVEKAAEIYRQILLERPSDEGIIAKLNSLELAEPAAVGGDAQAETEEPARDIFPGDADDVLDLLESWLQNTERMRRK